MPDFRRVVIETTGLADPAPILQAILRNPMLARGFRLEAVITLVDALLGRDHLVRFAEARRQLALADRIVLTKTDLAEEAELAILSSEIRQLNPRAPVLVADHGRVDAATLLPPGFLDPEALTDPTSLPSAPFAAETQSSCAEAQHKKVASSRQARLTASSWCRTGTLQKLTAWKAGQKASSAA